MPPLPEAAGPPAPRAEVFLAYLDHFRAVVVSKASGLTDEQLRTSLLPSGWTVLELVSHLAHVERRWLVWGFGGQPVPDPWGDAVDGRWGVPAEQDAVGVLDVVRELLDGQVGE